MCIVFILVRRGEERRVETQIGLMEQQRELTVQYYEDLEENYSESRKIIHDIRNHLHAIERKYELEQSGYIDDVHAMLNSLGMKFYTENRMLNIILNDKLKMLPSEQVDCNLGGISLEFLSDMDITTILRICSETRWKPGVERPIFLEDTRK